MIHASYVTSQAERFGSHQTNLPNESEANPGKAPLPGEGGTRAMS